MTFIEDKEGQIRSDAELLTPLMVAVTEQSPAPTAVTTPDSLTVAILALLVTQDAEVVTSREEPSS
jgi:hypothetical protein